MKMTLTRRQSDFEDFTATLNGEIVRHDTLISADVALGNIVRQQVDGDGVPLEEGGRKLTETVEGNIAIIERNEAVRSKEPGGERVKQVGLGKNPEDNPAPLEKLPEDQAVEDAKQAPAKDSSKK